MGLRVGVGAVRGRGGLGGLRDLAVEGQGVAAAAATVAMAVDGLQILALDLVRLTIRDVKVRMRRRRYSPLMVRLLHTVLTRITREIRFVLRVDRRRSRRY